ncbi:hypothetical protein ABZ027_35460, partial [Streptomyces sp. NPDC006332]|uniref:hypothetical protein n=1 Tax=Streptomyces sp. NPDC006332 TaxID=3155456 RepID=UPI0033ADDD7A
KLSLGADGPPGSYEDFDRADVFLVIGSNMADSPPARARPCQIMHGRESANRAASVDAAPLKSARLQLLDHLSFPN